ncbi:hypothetical protein NQ317_004006 [Molorchus minor]|uniref:RNA-directed DNA polymerase n=1 Tax=Molorchus minor TaxID=1323400 RepID=A0ABQ9JHA8_9CUCU|nr:hypothetical protein NQ317_004006 [Molorchus minor]
MVIDTGSYHTIVKPNILAHCKMKPTTNNFILETAGGETLPVIGVHEAEFQLGRTVFRHQVFVANITDDVLIGLELMKKHGFQLNLQERSIKTGQDEIIISMPRSDEKKDEDIKPFIAWKEEGTRPEWKDISNKSTTLKGYWAIWDSLIVEDGILKRLWENTDGKEIRKQIVLPRARVNEVLQEVHGGVGGGHFGVNKTLNKVRERFYWLRSRADVEDWCRRCAECASSKGPRTRSRGQMKQYNNNCAKDFSEFDKSSEIQKPKPVDRTEREMRAAPQLLLNNVDALFAELHWVSRAYRTPFIIPKNSLALSLGQTVGRSQYLSEH